MSFKIHDLTLGGRISILLGLILVAAWSCVVFGDKGYCRSLSLRILETLSYPLAFGYSHVGSGNHNRTFIELYKDLMVIHILFVGNCFILGYGIGMILDFLRSKFSQFFR